MTEKTQATIKVVGVLIVLIMVAITAAVLIAAATGRYDETPATTAPAPAPVQTSTATTADFKASFLDGCTGEGTSRAACECMYNHLERSIGISGMFTEMSTYLETGSIPPAFMDAAYACVESY